MFEIDFNLSNVNGAPAVWQAHYVETTGAMTGGFINPSRSSHERTTFRLGEGVYRVRYDSGVPAWLVIVADADGGYTVRKVNDEQAHRILEMWVPTSTWVKPVSIGAALAIAS